jgi:hypothetical protein
VSFTGTLPPLPDGALSSAQPDTNITITVAATATTKMMIRAVFAGMPVSHLAKCRGPVAATTGSVSSPSRFQTPVPKELIAAPAGGFRQVAPAVISVRLPSFSTEVRSVHRS